MVLFLLLANKSITMHTFTLLSVPVMISSLNNYWKPHLNLVGNLSLSKFITRAMKWRTLLLFKKSILSPVQPFSATNIDRIKYYLGPLEEILWNIPFTNWLLPLDILSAAILLDERIVLNSGNIVFMKSIREGLDNTWFCWY